MLTNVPYTKKLKDFTRYLMDSLVDIESIKILALFNNRSKSWITGPNTCKQIVIVTSKILF